MPANVAEGNGRVHAGDYVHHLSIARGSVMELDTLFQAAVRLGYVNEAELADVAELVDHVGRMLTRLIARYPR